MRTLVISSSYPEPADDAAGHFVESEVRSRVARGEQVTLIVPRGTKPRLSVPGLSLCEIPAGDAFGSPGLIARLTEPGQRLRRGAHALLFMARARRAAKRLASAHGVFDHAELHWLAPSAVPIFPRGIARQVELVAHGGDAKALQRLPRWLARAVLWHAAQRSPQTELRAVSNALLEDLRCLAEPGWFAALKVQPCALNLEQAPTRERARARHGVRGELWLVIARLVPSKRVAVALSAASALQRLRPARVVVVGDGPLKARLAQAFPTVEFLGQLPRAECLSWLAAADGLLSASREEGAPTSVREARALSVPVVCCAAGDLVEWAETDPGLRVVR